jgi:hypothetical protein
MCGRSVMTGEAIGHICCFGMIESSSRESRRIVAAFAGVRRVKMRWRFAGRSWRTSMATEAVVDDQTVVGLGVGYPRRSRMASRAILAHKGRMVQWTGNRILLAVIMTAGTRCCANAAMVKAERQEG